MSYRTLNYFANNRNNFECFRTIGFSSDFITISIEIKDINLEFCRWKTEKTRSKDENGQNRYFWPKMTLKMVFLDLKAIFDENGRFWYRNLKLFSIEIVPQTDIFGQNDHFGNKNCSFKMKMPIFNNRIPWQNFEIGKFEFRIIFTLTNEIEDRDKINFD